MHADKVIIKNLLVRGILGINPEERTSRQDILLNFTIYTDITEAGTSQDLTQSINYQAVTQRVIEWVESSQDLLAEKLALDLARLIITEFGAEKVSVRVEKPTAVNFTESVGVEIERSRVDFSS